MPAMHTASQLNERNIIVIDIIRNWFIGPSIECTVPKTMKFVSSRKRSWDGIVTLTHSPYISNPGSVWSVLSKTILCNNLSVHVCDCVYAGVYHSMGIQANSSNSTRNIKGMVYDDRKGNCMSKSIKCLYWNDVGLVHNVNIQHRPIT